MSASFAVVPQGPGSSPLLRLNKNALEKEFLLQANAIEQPIAALGRGLRSRVVYFKQRDGRLFLLESRRGHSVTADLPQTFILTAFPIVEETENSLLFDFNAGTAQIFTPREMAGRDLDGTAYEHSFKGRDVRVAFVDSARIVEDNHLVVHQIAQTEVLSSSRTGPTALETLEIRYYLSPYLPDPSYEPKPASDLRRMGFFETHGFLTEDGRVARFASRFHPDRPIRFAISANTPPEYVQAVRDGILYWNRALGRDMIEAVTGPEGVSAPAFTHNIVQWVPHDKANNAYADVQLDPRTGQILHAQAFITSTFALGGVRRARVLFSLIPEAPGITAHEHDASDRHICRRTADAAARELPRWLSTIDDENLLRVSQDYVRAVVAHEVGHLLGLRHNFAGSLFTRNYDIRDRERIFEEYLRSGEVPPRAEFASSVMDYPAFIEDVLIGRRIALGLPALRHDVMSIRYLYFGEEPKGAVPLFCTDSHLNPIADCSKFDFGPSPFHHAIADVNESTARMGRDVFEMFLHEMTKNEWDAPSPSGVDFDAGKIAKRIVGARSVALQALQENKTFVAVATRFPHVGLLNRDEARRAARRHVERSLRKAGGWSALLAPVPEDFRDHAIRQLEMILDETEAPFMEERPLSNDEAAEIREASGLLFERVAAELPAVDLAQLDEIPDEWKTTDALGEELARVLGARAESYLLATKGSAISAKLKLGGDPTVVKVSLPRFAHSTEIREKAIALLDAPKAGDADWADDEIAELETRYEKLLDDACGCEWASVDISKIEIVTSDERKRKLVKSWFADNAKLLKKLK